jgi:hypothetical protein
MYTRKGRWSRFGPSWQPITLVSHAHESAVGGLGMDHTEREQVRLPREWLHNYGGKGQRQGMVFRESRPGIRVDYLRDCGLHVVLFEVAA